MSGAQTFCGGGRYSLRQARLETRAFYLIHRWKSVSTGVNPLMLWKTFVQFLSTMGQLLSEIKTVRSGVTTLRVNAVVVNQSLKLTSKQQPNYLNSPELNHMVSA